MAHVYDKNHCEIEVGQDVTVDAHNVNGCKVQNDFQGHVVDVYAHDYYVEVEDQEGDVFCCDPKSIEVQ